MPPASTGASVTLVDARVPSVSPTSQNSSPPQATAPAPADTRMVPGGPGYRRMSLALFAAGLATFALLYSTQALLPLISADLGATASAASWTVSAATGGLALCVLPLSALSERFGRARLMTVSLSVALVVAVLVPFAPNLGALVALRAVQGAALAGVPASAMAYLGEEVRPRALVGAIGMFVAGNSIGGMSGRIVTGWVAQEWGWRPALAVIGMVSVACGFLFRALLPAPRHFTPATLHPRSVAATVAGHLRNPLLLRLYAIGGMFMTVFGAVYTVIGYRLSAEPFSLPQGVVGSIFVVYLVGTVASARAGRLVARLGRRGTLYLSAGTTAAGLVVSLADSLVLIVAGLVLITAGFFAGHAVASSSVSATATRGRAQASALYQSAYYIGSSLGGVLGAMAFHAAGWTGTALIGALAVLAVAGLTLMGTYAARAERHRQVPAGC
ncbi:MFS transporter [Streptomyces albidoflavus]|uniref:MFS transporter n=1 Tax=Streptomyces sp. M10 TaxID=412968 RepID=UPI00099B5F9A|nr:MFS transporter [Streptomyces sp. M10]